MLMSLPTDIIKLIMKYSSYECELCETEINKYIFASTRFKKHKYIFDSSICKECAEACISHQKKFSNCIEDNLVIYFHIKRIFSKKQIYKTLLNL